MQNGFVSISNSVTTVYLVILRSILRFVVACGVVLWALGVPGGSSGVILGRAALIVVAAASMFWAIERIGR